MWSTSPNTLIPLRRFTARWATPILRAAKAMGPFPSPFEQRTASQAKRGLSTASISQWSSFGRDHIRGRAKPVLNHKDRHLFSGEPSFGGPAAPFSGPSREPAPLPLVGSQEKSFVGFDDVAFLPRLKIGRQGQESVSPQKSAYSCPWLPPNPAMIATLHRVQQARIPAMIATPFRV